MKVTFKQLNLFLAIANSGSLRQGAENIYLSQPAASIALMELEGKLGQPLFDRIGKKLMINDNGRRLYPKAVELLERLEQAEQLFLQKSNELQGCLRIGASTTIGCYVLPLLLCCFSEKYPKVRLVQTIANSDAIVNALEKFQLDIGFIESDCFSEDLLVNLWGKDELIIFSSPDHILAKKKIITLKDLEQVDWVTREIGSGTRKIMEKYIQPRNIRLEVNNNEAIKCLVSQGKMISCVSRFSLQKELKSKNLTQLSIKNNKMERSFFQLIHKEKFHTNLIKEFLKNVIFDK